jgi:acetyl-CoA carboxylase biotin carboxyl carrier protein
MNPNNIQKLIDLVEKSNINELEVTRWGTKVRIVKNAGIIQTEPKVIQTSAPVPVPASKIEVHTPAPLPVVMPSVTRPVEPIVAPPAKEEKLPSNVIKIPSPMVGTFYRAPAPDAEPYVKVGDQISPGQVLCIIEAMKLMNEIEAECSGRIKEILAENAKPVEYNQVLFIVEPLA